MNTTETESQPLFELRRDFGIPKRLRSFHGESKYPVKTLNVGDAIVGIEKVVRGAAVAARTFRKKNPKTKFSMYKLEAGGLRSRQDPVTRIVALTNRTEPV